MSRRRTKGNTLSSLLAAMAIIAILAGAVYIGGKAFGGGATSSRKDGLGKTTLGAARYRAKDEVCRSNLGQVRQAIQIALATNEDTPPQTLEETRIGSDFYRCPIGKEPYSYDPTSGKVSCPHPGHETY